MGDTIEVEWTGADCSRRTCPRGISWSASNTNNDAGVEQVNEQTIDWKDTLDVGDDDIALDGPNVKVTFTWAGTSSVNMFDDVHAFTDCNIARSVEVATTSPFEFTVSRAGNFYFGHPTNCVTSNQKTHIAVTDGSSEGTIENWNTATEAQSITLTTTAKLTFYWTTGTHSVFKFNDKTAYDACDFASGTELGTTSPVVYTAGPTDTVAYFSTSAADACNPATGDPHKLRLRIAAAGPAPVINNGNNLRCFHLPETECSDQGLCDRATGLCSCFPGYSGSSCQRTVCPNDCSGHGTCRSNRDFAYDWAVAKSKQLHPTTDADNIQNRFEDTATTG